MRDPSQVARIVERMSTALEEYPHMELSIKHRLGVADAKEYDSAYDRQQDDTASLESCLNFAKAVTFTGAVRKLHVHGRLALLGDFEPEVDESASSLWIPRDPEKGSEDKVNHKRVQYRAKRKSRLATIKNRSVPPLRPTVVNQLAKAMQSIEFVSNGGINTMDDIYDRLDQAPPNLVGTMVGRAAINHPCSFAMVDTLWGEELVDIPTRGKVLEDYADYCEQEESRLLLLGRPPSFMEALRRRLVAVPFALFAGEDGNDAFQRRIRKLISRPGRHSARAVLLAALAEVPPSTLHRLVSEYSQTIELYREYNQRSGPLQRSIL
ncbi:tRNA dihydrouridine synthase [Fragilaria crotonensis]|nr:tRNA dihydrouridine synthase [Fragilaria crotonensis]